MEAVEPDFSGYRHLRGRDSVSSSSSESSEGSTDGPPPVSDSITDHSSANQLDAIGTSTETVTNVEVGPNRGEEGVFEILNDMSKFLGVFYFIFCNSLII
jgi:hypothetical protein